MKKSEAERLRSAATARLSDMSLGYHDLVDKWRQRAVRAAWDWFDSGAWRKKDGEPPPIPPPPPDLRVQLDLDDGMGK